MLNENKEKLISQFYRGFLVLIFTITVLTFNAQKTVKYADFRGGDSVWVVKHTLISRSKFFIGNQKVDFTTWKNQLQKEDAEIANLLNKGTQLRKASTPLLITGLIGFSAGMFLLSNSSESGNVNKGKQTAGIISSCIGIIGASTAIYLGQRGWGKYERALRLYNNKVLKSTNLQISVRFLMGPTYASVSMHW